MTVRDWLKLEATIAVVFAINLCAFLLIALVLHRTFPAWSQEQVTLWAFIVNWLWRKSNENVEMVK